MIRGDWSEIRDYLLREYGFVRAGTDVESPRAGRLWASGSYRGHRWVRNDGVPGTRQVAEHLIA